MTDQQADKLAQIRARIRAQKIAQLTADADLYHEAGITRVVVASLEPIRAELEKTVRSAVTTGVFLANLLLVIFAFIFGMLASGLMI